MLSFFFFFFFFFLVWSTPCHSYHFLPITGSYVIDNSIPYCPPTVSVCLIDWPATKTFWIKDLVRVAIHILATGVTSTTYHVTRTHHTWKWLTKKKKKSFSTPSSTTKSHRNELDQDISVNFASIMWKAFTLLL